MSVMRRSVVLLSLSLAAALALTAVGVGMTSSRAASSASGVGSASSGVWRSVVWYGVPQSSPRTFHIESTSVNAPSPDEFQITYTSGNFTLVYQRTAGGPITTQYTLTPRAVVEWNDTQANGQIEDGSIVATTGLGPNDFGRYAIQHFQGTQPDGVTTDSFLIVSNQRDVTFNLTIADGFVNLPSGKTLTPMEAKMSVYIDHNMTAANTRLSLQLGISTDQTVLPQNKSWDEEHDFSTDDSSVNVTNDNPSASSSAFFAWSNTATVNGVSGRVIASGPMPNETTGEQDLFLSYPKSLTSATHLTIVHDPTMGVISAAYDSTIHPGPGPVLPFQGDASVYAISLIAIAAFVAGTAILVSRRRPKRP